MMNSLQTHQNIDERSVKWLEEFEDKCKTDISKICKMEKVKFWHQVGRVKRLNHPNPDLVRLVSRIRELLYVARFGDVKPLNLVFTLLGFTGLGIIYSIFLLNNNRTIVYGLVLSCFFLTMLLLEYVWIIRANFKQASYAFSILVVSTVLLDVLLYNTNRDILIAVNEVGLLIIIPSWYIFGRFIGGKLSGIRFEGVNRDKYYLITLKVKYESYLLANPPNRQWVFFFGGIGTVLLGLFATLLQLFIFGHYYIVIFPLLLFLGEILDYLGFAGKLSGGEFHHLKRERRIIRDWKSGQTINYS